jgi:transcription antitermination factor NusG
MEIDVPLFPSYVFCRLDLGVRLPVLTTPGVLGIVGNGRIPMAVDDQEIAALQRMVHSGLDSEPWPFLEIGQRVRIDSGPLAGCEGILLEFKGKRRLVLSVTLLRRSVAVEVDRPSVLPCAWYGRLAA